MKLPPGLKNQNLWYYAIAIALTLILWLILITPVFTPFNNLLLDFFQGQTSPRAEIVIVGIDDASLGKLGSWPWSREVFAQAFDNLNQSNPAVIGIDVLFLESRAGDNELTNAISDSNTPIVMGSKLIDGQVLKGIFIDVPNVESGFVNFEPDSDGKIRNTQPTFGSQCELSLSLITVAKYLKVEPSSDWCKTEIKLRNTSFKPDSQNQLRFAYTREKFGYLSFGDVYQGSFQPEQVRNKIILVGSTALDLRSGLNDNFTDIFGRTIPGVEIHANIINSYLQNSFYSEIDSFGLLGILILITISLSYVYALIPKPAIDLAIFILASTVNIVGSALAVQWSLLWPILPVAIVLIVGYIYVLVFRYFTKSKENKYIRQVFGKYVNVKLLNQILAAPDRLKLGGETREMTVLFSDIRGFTTLSEGLTPQQLVEMVNDYLSYMSDIILQRDGTIDKYIGDAIMAFWNAPLDVIDHARLATRAALAMQQSLADFNHQYPQYPELHIGIGINTGEMTVGNVGGNARFDYTVLGDNVNLGSRLEGLTKKYGVTIICTESTMQQCNDSGIIFRQLDEVRVKGKTLPVKIYEPVEANPKNTALVEKFNQAFEAYQSGRFADATKLFNSLTNDKPSQMLLERITSIEPDNWDGVWDWDEK